MFIEYGYPDTDVDKVISYVGLKPRRAGLKMNRSVLHLCIDSN